jgi:antitoxin ParD1/3/4
MNINLKPELEQFVKEKVAKGHYKSVDEAVNEGLRLLTLQDDIYKVRFEELTQEIMIGIKASERGEVVDGEIAMGELRQKLLQKKEAG